MAFAFFIGLMDVLPLIACDAGGRRLTCNARSRSASVGSLTTLIPAAPGR